VITAGHRGDSPSSYRSCNASGSAGPGGADQARPDHLAGVHSGLAAVDGTAALAFALALLASRFASSGVGTLAGQVVLQGYLRRRIPILVRRALTLAPALAVLAIGVDPTRALVLSQVVLSFGIPFALVPLVLLTRRRDVMGDLVNRPVTTITASVVAAVIIALNAFLLFQVMTGGAAAG
jgi:manganese transport protein